MRLRNLSSPPSPGVKQPAQLGDAEKKSRVYHQQNAQRAQREKNGDGPKLAAHRGGDNQAADTADGDEADELAQRKLGCQHAF